MDSVFDKFIILCVSVSLTSSVVFAILYSVTIGYSITSSTNDSLTEYYSTDGISMLLGSSKCDYVDSCTLYKVLEGNRTIINDYKIEKEIRKGSNFSIVNPTIDELLDNPTDKYTVEVYGDSAIGYILDAYCLKVEEVVQ